MARPARDVELVQIVDAALADAARRAGDWLVCRPGCTPCCHGPFLISTLDQLRLQAGLEALAAAEPERAAALRGRIAAEVARLRAGFEQEQPGAVAAPHSPGLGEYALADEHDDQPCPILSLDTGTCDLYEYRPMTCRVFGPPVESEDGLGHCELCFIGATEQMIRAAEMYQTYGALERELTAEAEKTSRSATSTIIALALAAH